MARITHSGSELLGVELDESKDAGACRVLDGQIRDLKDQQRMLNKRWTELTRGSQKNLKDVLSDLPLGHGPRYFLSCRELASYLYAARQQTSSSYIMQSR